MSGIFHGVQQHADFISLEFGHGLYGSHIYKVGRVLPVKASRNSKFALSCMLFICNHLFLTCDTEWGEFSVRIYGRTSFLSVFLFIALGVAYFLFVSCLFTITPVRITKIFAFVGRLSLRLMCIHMLLFCMMGMFFGEILHYKILLVLDIILVILVAWLLEIIFRMSNSKFLTRYL